MFCPHGAPLGKREKKEKKKGKKLENCDYYGPFLLSHKGPKMQNTERKSAFFETAGDIFGGKHDNWPADLKMM